MNTATRIDLTMPHRRLLLWANLFMLIVIGIHDADHARQARIWCYSIPSRLWLINLVAYLPNASALWLALRRRVLASVVTVAAGVFIATEFAKVHLWRPTFAVWGIWNRNFFQLQVDARSWWILVGTIVSGIGVSLVGAYVAGAAHGSRSRPVVL